MSTKSRLDKLYRDCRRISLPEDVKILFISDTHMGDGGPEDDFTKNELIFQREIRRYEAEEYYLIFLGDVYDLWECPDEHKIIRAHSQSIILIKEYDKAIQIKGNHDNSLDYPEAVVLQIGDMEIFCCHGMQGDWANDNGKWVGKFFVRWIWVPLQWLGLHDPQVAKQKRHEAQEARLYEWANEQSFISIFGHTHMLARINKYLDTGSWVYTGGEGIIFENGKFKTKHF